MGILLLIAGLLLIDSLQLRRCRLWPGACVWPFGRTMGWCSCHHRGWMGCSQSELPLRSMNNLAAAVVLWSFWMCCYVDIVKSIEILQVHPSEVKQLSSKWEICQLKIMRDHVCDLLIVSLITLYQCSLPPTLSQAPMGHCLPRQRGTVKPIPSWTFTKNSSGAEPLAPCKGEGDEAMSRKMMWSILHLKSIVWTRRFGPSEDDVLYDLYGQSGWHTWQTRQDDPRLPCTTVWLSPRWIYGHHQR